MRSASYGDMTDAHLLDHIRRARESCSGWRFQHATGELDNTPGLGRAKRESLEPDDRARAEIYNKPKTPRDQ